MKFTRQLLTFLQITGLAFGIGFAGAYLLHRFDTVMILAAGALFGAGIMYAFHIWALRQHLKIQREKQPAPAQREQQAAVAAAGPAQAPAEPSANGTNAEDEEE